MEQPQPQQNPKVNPLPGQDQATVRLKDQIVDELLERKAENLVVLDLRAIEKAVADFFIIATGTSNTHLSALSEHVEEAVENTGERVWSKEGHGNGQWIILDYATTVVHLFRRDTREHYGLEQLWGDAVMTEYED